MFELLVAAGLILVNGVFALSELAVVSSRKSRLKLLAEQGRAGAAAALKLAENPGRFLSTVQIGITLIGILAGAFSGAALGDRLGDLLELQGLPPRTASETGYVLVISAITFFAIVVGELVPKNLALKNPERFACIVAPPMNFLSRAAAPLGLLLDAATRAILYLSGTRGEPEGAITDEEIRSVIAEAEAAGVTLAFDVADNLPPHVAGDSYRLRQILLNLTANAVKFTPPGGRVRVSVSTAAPESDPVPVRFEVRDTGIGMDAVTVKRIFERFTQADSSTTRRFGGSGLGLAISSHLVRLLGGQIQVESTPDQGSCFFFTLTFPRANELAASVPETASLGAPLPLHVLVVEDNPVNRSIIAAQLNQLGCRHAIARDGEEALAALAVEPLPDVILMDCHMPRLDGWETTRRLRAWADSTDDARQRASSIPIVALTAAALPEERQRCVDAGMDDFLSKPMRLAELERVLRKYAQAAA